LHLNEPFFTNVGTGFQTNGKGIFTKIETGQGLKKWSYAMGGNYTKIGDRHAPDYSLTNSGKEEKSMNVGVRYRTKIWDFNTYYSFVDQNLALLRSSVAESGNAFVRAINADRPVIVDPFSYNINEPNQLTQHHLGKAELSWQYSDDAKLTFRAGKQLNKRQEYDVRRNADKPIINLELTTSDYQLEWKHPDWKKLDGLVGVQLFTQNNDNNPGTGTTPFIPNYNTLRYSGFIIESFTKHKNTFETGLRVDYEHNNVRGRETNQDIFKDDYSFTNLTASLGYIRKISENSTFRTNLGTAWRTPNMAELYSFGQHGFKTTFGLMRHYANENGELRTDKVAKIDESSVAPEKGFKWINEWSTQKKNNSYTLTGYANYIQNFIFNRPLAVIGTIRGPMPVFVFEQADVFLVGADFTWQRNWNRHLSGVYSFSYLWSKNMEKNEPLINQPPISTSYKLSWQAPQFWNIKASQVEIKPRYTFRQFHAPRTVSPEALIDGSVVIGPNDEIFDFMNAPKGYFLLDLAWSFNIGKLKSNIAVQNVFNTSYRNYLNEMRYFADDLGRNFLLSINYTFNSKSNKK
jgi:iron complex outermembrane recepter protein